MNGLVELVARLAIALPLLCGGALLAQAQAAPLSCGDLATLPNAGLAGNGEISGLTAAVVAAGTPEATIGPPPGALPAGVRMPAAMPPQQKHAAYCKVSFTYSSRSGTKDGYAPGQSQHIRIVIGLPLSIADGGGGGGVNGAWNGKIENLGGAGCAGAAGSPTQATDAGYVGSSTDTGHTAQENGTSGMNNRCNFGVVQATHQLDKGMIDDFIYEGMHEQVEWAKKLAATYYQSPVLRNYWNGCSTGGRQGLAMAQKYGDEFDGIVAGAPAINWQEFRLADAWPTLVVRDRLTAEGKSLSQAQFAAAAKAAVASCDLSADGKFHEGYIDDPRACTFSAKANICGVKSAPGAGQCLDADQAAAIDEIWRGPTNKYGISIWYPFDRGIALTANGFMGGYGAIPSSTGQVMAYDHGDLNISTDLLFTDEAAIVAAGNPKGAITYAGEAALGSKVVDDLMETRDVDLDKAKNHGTKIIMWQGNDDSAIRWTGSADYYRRVATHYGNGTADFAGLQSWFRYYHAPGVGHCGGGDGPAPVNIFQSLVDWVEKDKAPDQILASGGNVNPQRSRPLCPWPTTAIYTGAGSREDAANYSCGGNLDANLVAVCRMVHTEYKHENQDITDAADKGIDIKQCHSAAEAN